MYLGLSEELVTAFPGSHGLTPDQDKAPQRARICIIARPLNSYKKVINPNLLSMFISAQGKLFVNILNYKTKVGKLVILIFYVSQHSRYAYLLWLFCKFLGCGKYYLYLPEIGVTTQLQSFLP